MQSQFTYRADIDGLRAISVMMVVLYHAGIGFPGGYIGVDVFFVISGFLITSVLRKGILDETFSLKHFWERRIRRILPAASVCIATTFVLGTCLLMPASLVELGDSVILQQLMLSNFYFWRTGDYFGGPSELKPLLHRWSLSVEEQFYLGYPILLVLLQRLVKNWTLIILSALAIASFALSEWGVHSFKEPTFYLLPTRSWELLAGGIVAFCPISAGIPKHVTSFMGFCGVGSILYAGIKFNAATEFPGASALWPCIGAVLLIYSGTEVSTLVRRSLSFKPVVFVGLISYSLYLWHWPIFAFSRYWLEPLGLVTRLFAIGLSFACAVLSWRYVETPFRKGWPSLVGRKLVFATMISTLLLIAAAFWVKCSKGLPQRFSPEVLEISSGVLPDGYGGSNKSSIDRDTIPLLGVGEDPSFLVWGDSHAKVIAELCDRLAASKKICGAIAYRRGVPPLLNTKCAGGSNDCIEWNTAVFNYAVRNKVKHVILACRWSLYVDSADGSRNLLEGDGTQNAATSVMLESLGQTVSMLSDAGIKVWILREVPLQEFNPVRKLQLSAILKRPPPSGTTQVNNHNLRENSRQVLDRMESLGAHMLNPEAYCFDNEGFSIISDGVRSVYVDDNHLSSHGVNLLLQPLFSSLFDRLTKSE